MNKNNDLFAKVICNSFQENKDEIEKLKKQKERLKNKINKLKNQLKQKNKVIDECIELIKYRLSKNDGRVNPQGEIRYYNQLLEKLQQMKGDY